MLVPFIALCPDILHQEVAGWTMVPSKRGYPSACLPPKAWQTTQLPVAPPLPHLFVRSCDGLRFGTGHVRSPSVAQGTAHRLCAMAAIAGSPTSTQGCFNTRAHATLVRMCCSVLAQRLSAPPHVGELLECWATYVSLEIHFCHGVGLFCNGRMTSQSQQRVVRAPHSAPGALTWYSASASRAPTGVSFMLRPSIAACYRASSNAPH